MLELSLASSADDQTIYDNLKSYQAIGIIDYVLPTEPLGESWVVGVDGRILKFSTREAIVSFLAGIHTGVKAAANAKAGRLNLRDTRSWDARFDASQEERKD